MEAEIIFNQPLQYQENPFWPTILHVVGWQLDLCEKTYRQNGYHFQNLFRNV